MSVTARAVKDHVQKIVFQALHFYYNNKRDKLGGKYASIVWHAGCHNSLPLLWIGTVDSGRSACEGKTY